MDNKFLCDNHMHSKFSFDGKESIYDLYNTAKQKGLNIITITDHFDCMPVMNEKEEVKRAESILSEIDKITDKEASILKGIELGQALDNISLSNKLLGNLDFDFVLLSLHNLTDKPDFYYMSDFSEGNVYLTLSEYFKAVSDSIEFEKFDSLAHLTYPLRYILPAIDFNFDFSRFSDVIDEILLKLVHKNKALEVNSSGLRQEIKDLLPNKSIIRRFKELGGKYITVGSDAHCCDDVGKGIKEALSAIEESGFEYITVFKRHKPVLYKITCTIQD